MLHRRGRALLHAALCLSFLYGAVAWAAAQRVVEVEGFTEYRLDNGLRVVLGPDKSQATTTVNLTYLVGSRMEGGGETGMAHLLEHLLFKGTPAIPNLYQELTRRGMRTNATTMFDRTNYFETFSASPETLEWALRMEADRMVNAFVAQKDLDSEMTVVRNEMERGENNAAGMLGQMVMSAAYRWHPYGRAVIGARSDVEHVPIENLQAFYRKYYQPDNAVLVVVGNFETERTLQWIERYFGAIPRPTRELRQTHTVEPPQEGPRRVEFRRTGENRHLVLLYHTPPAMHADYPPLLLLRQILDANPGGRLQESLVKPGLAIATAGWLLAGYDPGFVMFSAELRKEQEPAAASRILLQQVETLAAKSITEEELARARQATLAWLDSQLANPATFGITLSQAIAAGDWRLFFLLREQVARVSVADLQRVARLYLRADNRTLGEFVPVASTAIAVGGRQDFGAALAALPAKSSLADGEAFDTTPAAIEARTQRVTFDNGMEVALLPKKTRGERVKLNLSLRLGDADSMSDRGLMTQLASQLLLAGTRRYDRTRIAALAESLDTGIVTSGSGQTITLTVDTVRKNLPAVLDLLREILREPTFPDEELARVARQRIGTVRDQEQDPTTQAQRALLRHLLPFSPQDPRYLPDAKEFEARLRGVEAADVRAFWQDFAGADHAWLSVVGDFDPAEVTPALRERFADWRSARRYAELPEAWQEIAPQVRAIELSNRQNAIFQGGRRIPVGEGNADYPAVLLATHLVGGGFLNSRLADRLRQREGLSYNVSASALLSSTADNGLLLLSAIYAPQYRARVEQAVREELQRVARDGFTAEELKAGRESLLQSARVNRSADANLAATLTQGLRLKRDFLHEAEKERRLEALTLEQLNAAARRYFDPEGMSLFFAGSFAATAKVARLPDAKSDVPGGADK